jgi:protein-tyrosine-phosphatase
MAQKSFIVFVCEHGAAKSILASAYFNKLAVEKRLNLYAIARATHPDQELSQKTIDGLRKDGLLPTETAPKIVVSSEIEDAVRVIAFCELPLEYRVKATVEQWDGVPPVSDDYGKARDAIIEKLNSLLETIG